MVWVVDCLSGAAMVQGSFALAATRNGASVANLAG